MTQTTKTNKFLSLKTIDFLKGLLMAVLTPVLTIIYTSLQAGELKFNWPVIGATAGAAFVAYLLKNLFSPTEIVITNPTPSDVKAVDTHGAEAKVMK